MVKGQESVIKDIRILGRNLEGSHLFFGISFETIYSWFIDLSKLDQDHPIIQVLDALYNVGNTVALCLL